MDILELIKAEHRQVETLFSKIESTDEPQKLYECFNQLYNGLNVLAEFEEQTFYPAIRHCQDIEKLIDAAQKKHDEAKQILEELESFSPTSAEFKQKIGELKQVIQHYVQKEEDEVFSQVRECMSKEEREQLGKEFEAVSFNPWKGLISRSFPSYSTPKWLINP